MTTPPRDRRLYVAVIGDNPGTIDALGSYLEGADVTSHMSRSLHDVSVVAGAASVLVLFPDEFEASVVIDRVRALRTSRPELLLVVVTAAPQRLAPALDPDGHSALPVVLPKPAFGWTILDAIRDHAKAVGP